MNNTIRMVASEVLMCGLKQVPVVGLAVEVVDNVIRRHEALGLERRLDQVARELTSFDQKMRELVHGEIRLAVSRLSSSDLPASEFSSHIGNLMDIRRNGWSPALFQGLLERSEYWHELIRNPSHYGTILNDASLIDPNKLQVFIDVDKTRILELTPFALHALLSRQKATPCEPHIVSASDVWAFRNAPPQIGSREPAKLISNRIGMQLALLPAGRFVMGSPNTDPDALDPEKPQHPVQITKPFYLGVYPVTQAEYEQVMGNNPSCFKGDPRRPVENVSWEDALSCCRKLSEKEGQAYRLPSEAEWEYACRAGSTTRYSFGDSPAQLGEFAWYGQNSGQTTHPVGQKKPNAWGLYDMPGNVWEWCSDWYGPYTATAVDDPTGPAAGSLRVCRGGGWASTRPTAGRRTAAGTTPATATTTWASAS